MVKCRQIPIQNPPCFPNSYSMFPFFNYLQVPRLTLHSITCFTMFSSESLDAVTSVVVHHIHTGPLLLQDTPRQSSMSAKKTMIIICLQFASNQIYSSITHKFRDTANVLNSKCYYRPKRSFGQGYVFTCVCDSVHRGGGGYFSGGIFLGGVFWGGSPNFLGGFLQIFRGSIFGGVSKFSGGVFFWGVLQIFGGGGFSTGIRSTFGQDASYWNAFLLVLSSYFHSVLQ